jgi:Leucine-rich repeat (LRR) protein
MSLCTVLPYPAGGTLVPTSACTANKINNGGFQEYATCSGTIDQGGWCVQPNTSTIYPWISTSPANTELYSKNASIANQPYEGQWQINLNSYNVSQCIPTVSGQAYVVTFHMKTKCTTGASYGTIKASGALPLPLIYNTSLVSAWELVQYTFTAVASATELQFSSSGNCGLFLDSVTMQCTSAGSISLVTNEPYLLGQSVNTPVLGSYWANFAINANLQNGNSKGFIQAIPGNNPIQYFDSKLKTFNRVLVLSKPGEEALATNILDVNGKTSTIINVPITGLAVPLMLTDGNNDGLYNFIIMTSAMIYNVSGGWYSVMKPGDMQAIYDYQSKYNVRLVKLNDEPDSSLGVSIVEYTGDVRNVTLTPGQTNFASVTGLNPNFKAITSGIFLVPGVITNPSIATSVLSFMTDGNAQTTTAAAIINQNGRLQLSFFMAAGTWSTTTNILGTAWYNWAYSTATGLANTAVFTPNTWANSSYNFKNTGTMTLLVISSVLFVDSLALVCVMCAKPGDFCSADIQCVAGRCENGVCNASAGCPTLFNILNIYTSWGASIKASTGLAMWDSSNPLGCCGWTSKVLCDSTKLKVTSLDFNSVQLTGGIPTQMGSLTALQFLYLNNNQLNGTIPTQLRSLTALQFLSLYSNQLSGTIPSQLGNLTALQYLYLYNNQLSGAIPSQLESLTALRYLYLYSNQLSGIIPTQLGNLTALQYLSLYSNQLSGIIPTQLGNMTALQHLYLYSNQLSGTIPYQLENLTTLRYLYLYSNQLSGTIPTQLGNMNSLQFLYLYNNQLSGTIPTQLGNLITLKSLQLYSNQLSGTIPSQLENLTALQYLYLNSNQLSGTIPSQLGNLTALRYLYLYSNQLSGTIPTQLGMLTALVFLDFKMNKLNGTIPTQVCNLRSSKNFMSNEIIGPKPNSC